MNPALLMQLIPAAVSLFAGNKKSSGGSPGSVVTQPNMPDWQYGLGENLSGWANKFLGMYNPGQPYGGPLTVTKPTDIESMGLGELGGLLKQPATGELFGAAKGQLLDTLSGKYANPETSPFIQSFTKLAGQNLRDSINTERGQRGARGSFFTKAGINAESTLSERTQNYLNSLIGDFLNTERGRQLTAVPLAQSLEGYGTEASLKRVSASQTYGDLQRLLDQADLENRYKAWIDQRNELSGVPGVAASLFKTPVPLTRVENAPKPATSGTDIAPWVNLAMQILPQLIPQLKGA